MDEMVSFVPEFGGFKFVKPELSDLYQIVTLQSANDPDRPSRLLFRFLPAGNAKCPAFWPDGRIGPWLFATHGAQIFTPTRRLAFFLSDPRQVMGDAARQTPYWVLYERVRQAVESHAMPHWQHLIRSEFDRTRPPPVLTPPAYLFLAQAQVITAAIGQDPVYDPNLPVSLLFLRGALGWALANALRAFRRSAAYQDVVDPQSGVLVEFRPAAAGGMSLSPGVFHFKTAPGYDIVFIPSPDAKVAQATLEQTRWWYDILHFPTDEEQIRWLESVLPADVLRYGFRNTRFEAYLSGHSDGRTVESGEISVPSDHGNRNIPGSASEPMADAKPAVNPSGELASDDDIEKTLDRLFNSQSSN